MVEKMPTKSRKKSKTKKTVIRTPFPTVEETVKESGVPKSRFYYLKGLVDGIRCVGDLKEMKGLSSKYKTAYINGLVDGLKK